MPVAHILGEEAGFAQQNIPGHAIDYFRGRDCWVDCRWPGMITIDPTAHIGQCVCLVVGSHDTKPGQFGRVLARPLVIKARAQIYSFAQLFSCTIGEDSIVAMGTVVRSMDVPPGCMVEGNPARIIKRLVGGKWIRV